MIRNCLAVLAFVSLAGSAGLAQPNMAVGSPPGWNAALTRLFGDIKAFTAKAELPVLAAYVEMPLPEEEAAALNKNFKMHKTALGKETLDGHPCAKDRVMMTDEHGQKLEFIVWSAADLKNFPLQAQMNDAGAIVVIRYQNVQFARPDAKQFVAPPGYTKHKDLLQLTEAAALKPRANTPKKK